MKGPQEQEPDDYWCDDEPCEDCGKVKCECDREPADVYYDDDGDCYGY
jgi:hypothetical protein